jgi:hypothetical protein
MSGASSAMLIPLGRAANEGLLQKPANSKSVVANQVRNDPLRQEMVFLEKSS